MNRACDYKRIFLVISALVLLAVAVTAAWRLWPDDAAPSDQPKKNYTDIDRTSWYYESVLHCIDKGWIEGVDQTHFSPDAPVTRAVFINALYRLAGLPSVEGSLSFPDVSEDAVYADAVLWAAQKGIVETAGDCFFPEEALKREDMACMVYAYIQKLAPEIRTAEPFIDLSYSDMDAVSEDAYHAVELMRCTGLLSKSGEEGFRPKDAATRAEVAVLLQRMEERSRQ